VSSFCSGRLNKGGWVGSKTTRVRACVIALRRLMSRDHLGGGRICEKYTACHWPLTSEVTRVFLETKKRKGGSQFDQFSWLLSAVERVLPATSYLLPSPVQAGDRPYRERSRESGRRRRVVARARRSVCCRGLRRELKSRGLPKGGDTRGGGEMHARYRKG